MKSVYLLLIGLALWLPVRLGAQTAKEFYEEGNKRYDAGFYSQAIEAYQKALAKDSVKFKVSANYKIGLACVKLKDCSMALTHFRLSYQGDPVKGGASTPQKFEQKLKECGYTLADMKASASKAAVAANTLAEANADSFFDLEKGIADLHGQNVVAILYQWRQNPKQDPKQAKQWMDEANKNYEAKKYREAYPLYIKAAAADTAKWGAKALFKGGLSLQKVHKCEEARRCYTLAKALDPANGGASSPAKFEENIQRCNFTLAQIQDELAQKIDTLPTTSSAASTAAIETPPMPKIEEKSSGRGWLFWLIISALVTGAVYWFIQRRKKQTEYDDYPTNGAGQTGYQRNAPTEPNGNRGGGLGTAGKVIAGAAGGALAATAINHLLNDDDKKREQKRRQEEYDRKQQSNSYDNSNYDVS